MYKANKALSIIALVAFCGFGLCGCDNETLDTEVNLFFYVAARSADNCGDCKPLSYTDVHGISRTMYARGAPDLVISRSEIEQVLAFSHQERPATVSIVLNEAALAKLESLSSSILEDDDAIVVAADDFVLGDYWYEDLKILHGVFVFSFRERDQLESAMTALGITELIPTWASKDDVIATCLSAAGDDAKLKQVCEQLYDFDRDADARSLERVEKLLKSSHPDYEAIDKELGID